MDEEWKNITIKDYEHYMISNLGRVKNSKTNHIMYQGDNGCGYCTVKLKNNGVLKTVYVHRLVAEAFLCDWDSSLQVNHIDKNKRNNCVDNLEMVTDSENKTHSREEYVTGHLKAQGKLLEVYDLDGVMIEEHLGVYKYCREHNIHPIDVWKVATGERDSFRGLRFKIVNVG